jgi:hypothetical protein
MYELIDSEPSVAKATVFWPMQGDVLCQDTSAFRGDEKGNPDEMFASGEVAPVFQHKANVIPASIFVNCEDTPAVSLIAHARSTVQGEGLTLVIDTACNFTHWPKESYTAFLELPRCNTEEEKVINSYQVIKALDNAFKNDGIWCMDYSDIAPVFSGAVRIKIKFIDVELGDLAKSSMDGMGRDKVGATLVIGTSPVDSLGEFGRMEKRLQFEFGDHHFIFNQYHHLGQSNYRLVCFSRG